MKLCGNSHALIVVSSCNRITVGKFVFTTKCSVGCVYLFMTMFVCLGLFEFNKNVLRVCFKTLCCFLEDTKINKI